MQSEGLLGLRIQFQMVLVFWVIWGATEFLGVQARGARLLGVHPECPKVSWGTTLEGLRVLGFHRIQPQGPKIS